MALGSLKDCHIIVLKGTNFHSDYTPPNLKKWIENAGGHVTFKGVLTEQTTHVVMDENTWMDQGPFIQQIFQAEIKDTSESKGRAIHIVSFDWLQECLDNRVKRREGSFKWKNLAGGVLKGVDGGEKLPCNVQGLYKQTFIDYTNEFAIVGEKKRLEKRKRQEAEAQADELEEEKRQFQIYRKKMSIPEQAAVFRKGAKRARTDILSDNHHIYVDDTGFPFDVTITKVDFNNNANERYVLTLQIYESNSEPQSYAFSSSFAGTKALPRNDIIAAIGSNFRTAFRAFKKTFKEYTKVDWDNRILGFNEREAKAKMGGGKEKPFDLQDFEYYPPKYGPIGELPLDQVEAMVAMVKAAEAEKVVQPSPVVDEWVMSGGNGPRHDSPGFETFMASSAEQAGSLPSDQLNSPFVYPFEFADGGKEDAIVVDDDEETLVPQYANNEQNNLTDNMGAPEVLEANVDKEKTNSQQAPALAQVDPPIYQQPAEIHQFDEDLDLTQFPDFPEFFNGSSQIPSQPLYTAQTQAFDQTQVAEAARADLLSDEQTQENGAAEANDDVDSEPSTVKKVNGENYGTISQAQDEGVDDGTVIDLGVEVL